ncbi:DUF2637 domain-containing protein [Streptomyces sp. NPDC058439]|uniref:DUF2637 domain-containing protein n=1 Tax=Streptomyces sp. NPDC058439 TaxID=3346500 RepID=UPI00365E34CA
MKRVFTNPKTLLVVALVGVVGMGFRVSWNALRDVARAIGADSDAAMLYPFVVDGLMALALIATLILTGRERKFALWVLGGYTVASLLLNYVHGLVAKLHQPDVGMVRLADWDIAHYVLVLIATSLPVGAIFFGSDLVAKVLHHRPAAEVPAEEQADEMPAEQDVDESDLEPVSEPVHELVVPELVPEIEAPAPVDMVKPKPRAVAESTGARPRRATGKVPAVAATPRQPRRSMDELMTEAREATKDDTELSAEQIRLRLRVGAAKARELRDLLQAERDERHHGLHLVQDDDQDDEPAEHDESDGGDQPTGTDS